MEFIFIIAVIVISVVNAHNKKKKQAEAAAKRRADVRSLEGESARADERLRDYQAQRQQRTARREAPAAPAVPTARAAKRPADPAWRCTCGAANREGTFCTACGRARYGGSMGYVSSEGRGASGEGMSAPVMKPERPEGSPRPAAPTVRHIVKPLTESGHSHVESSISGIEDCYDTPEAETPAGDAYAIGGEERTLPYGLTFNQSAAVQGLLYAEILGKPKGLRRRGA